MLAKRTSRSQLKLPKAVVDRYWRVHYGAHPGALLRGSVLNQRENRGAETARRRPVVGVNKVASSLAVR